MTLFLGTLFDGISKGAIYSLIAVALVLVWRSTRVVNFAQAAQAVFTTYVALTVFQQTDSYWLAFLAAILGGVVIGALVDWLVMRPVSAHAKGGYGAVTPVIATLGLLSIFQSLSGVIWGQQTDPYPSPVSTKGIQIFGMQLGFSPFDLFTVAAVLTVVLGFAYLIQRTGLGLALRAAAFRPDIAALSGIRVNRMRILGWAMAGAAGAVAGVLITPTGTLSPNALDLLLVFGFTAAVIGGLDSLIGAVVGALILGLGLAFITAYLSGSITFISVFLVLLAVLLIRPRGIFGTAEVRRA